MKVLVRAALLLAVSWSAGMVIRLVFDRNGEVFGTFNEALFYDLVPMQSSARVVTTFRQITTEDSGSFVHNNANGTMKMNKRTALWVGSYPMKELSLEEKKRRRLSVVISHCNKPVNWIQEYIHDTISELDITLDSVTIVSKCGKPVVGAMPGSTIVRLPNVGRCDHTYAQWIANMTEVWTSPSSQVQVQQQLHADNNIANTRRQTLTDIPPTVDDDDRNHFVLFIKDNDYRAQTYHYRSFRHVLEIVEGPSGFACIEPPLQLPGMSMSLYHNYTALRSFGMHSYNGTQKKDPLEGTNSSLNCHGTNATSETCTMGNELLPTYEFKSKYSSFGEWIDDLDIERHLMQGKLLSASPALEIHNPSIAPVCSGGIFATTKHQIRKATVMADLDDDVRMEERKTVFHRLADSLSRQDNIEEGHFAERIWAALLSNPLDWEEMLHEVHDDLPPKIKKRIKLMAKFTKKMNNDKMSSALKQGGLIVEGHTSSIPYSAGSDAIHWKNLFAPFPVETKCQGNFVPHCGVQTMPRKSFQRLSDGFDVQLVIRQ